MTSHFESLAASAKTRVHQYNQLLDSTKGLQSCVILADFNHSAYEELKFLVKTQKHLSLNEIPPFTDCGHPAAIQRGLSQASSSSSADPLRDNATFGLLYPFYEGSRRKEKRKPRRLDLVLVKGDEIQLVRQWTDGHIPIQVDRRERSSKEVKEDEVKTQKVKLRCQQGKGGNTCEFVALSAEFLS